MTEQTAETTVSVADLNEKIESLEESLGTLTSHMKQMSEQAQAPIVEQNVPKQGWDPGFELPDPGATHYREAEKGTERYLYDFANSVVENAFRKNFEGEMMNRMQQMVQRASQQNNATAVGMGMYPDYARVATPHVIPEALAGVQAADAMGRPEVSAGYRYSLGMRSKDCARLKDASPQEQFNDFAQYLIGLGAQQSPSSPEGVAPMTPAQGPLSAYPPTPPVNPVAMPLSPAMAERQESNAAPLPAQYHSAGQGLAGAAPPTAPVLNFPTAQTYPQGQSSPSQESGFQNAAEREANARWEE